MILELTTYKNGLDKLLTPTKPYVFADHKPEETKQLAKDMIAAVYHYNGLAIAGNQVNLPWSVMAFRGSPEDFTIFNPVIQAVSDELIVLEEACLSFPKFAIKVKRPKSIRIAFNDLNGAQGSQEFTGMTARVLQHEMKHLEGKMFFEGTSRIYIERAIRQAQKREEDYSGMGFMKYARS